MTEVSPRLVVRLAGDDAVDAARCAPSRVVGQLAEWAHLGALWSLIDPTDDAPPDNGALTSTVGDGVVQIHAVWSNDASTIGRLLAGVADRHRAHGARRLTVIVADDELEQAGTLVACGFRMTHVERGACTRERGWRVTIPRDGLWLEHEL